MKQFKALGKNTKGDMGYRMHVYAKRSAGARLLYRVRAAAITNALTMKIFSEVGGASVIRLLYAALFALMPLPGQTEEIATLYKCKTVSMLQVLDDGALGPNDFTRLMMRLPPIYIVDTVSGFVRGGTLGNTEMWRRVQEGTSENDFVATNLYQLESRMRILRVRGWSDPPTFVLFDQIYDAIWSGTCEAIE